MAAASVASTSDSTNNCITIRPRPAPSAVLTAISVRPRGDPRQRQRADIAARDGQQEQAHEKSGIRPAVIRAEIHKDLGKRQHVWPEVPVRVRLLGGHAQAHDPRLGFDLLSRHAVPKPSENPELWSEADVVVDRPRLKRDPEVIAIRKEEPWRHHTDDRSSDTAELKGAAEDVRRAVEEALPHVVSDHDDGFRAFEVIRLDQRAAELRADACDGERRRGDLGAADDVHQAVVADHVLVPPTGGGQRVERGHRLSPSLEIVDGRLRVVADLQVPVLDAEHPMRLLDRRWRVERVDELHRREADRNADRQGESADDRETGIPDEHPARELDVQPWHAGDARPCQPVTPDAHGRRHHAAQIAPAGPP